MTPYQQSVENAQNWKSVVSKLWKRQETILLLSILTVGILVALSVAVDKITPSPFVELDRSLLTFIEILTIVLFGLILVIYAFYWVVFATLKKWREVAPESLKKSINLVAIGLMIILIGGTVSYIVDDLETLGKLATLAGVIVQFVGIVQVRQAKDMPELARKGASSIMWGTIASWITGLMVILVAVFIFAEMAINDRSISNTNTYETSNTFGRYNDYNDYDYYDYYDDDMTMSVGKYDESVWNAMIVMMIIALIGSVISAYLTYRGWWLIGKSELPVLPEPTEELDYEVVASTSEKSECDIAE